MIPENIFRNFFLIKVMKLLTVLVCLVFCQFEALQLMAQGEFEGGVRYQALAGASVCLTGCWSVFGNQAGLAGIDRAEVGGSFQNRFLVRELSTRSALAVLPVHTSVFAISFSQFGEPPFRQEKMGLAYARSLTKHFNFGLQFNYYRLFLSEENRSVGSAGLELGCQYFVSDKLIFGIHWRNPYQTKIQLNSAGFRFDSAIRIGAGYQLTDDFSLTSELVGLRNQQIKAILGAEYQIFERLTLRGGVSGKPYRLSGGMGFMVGHLNCDIAVSYDENLGNSPSVAFQYHF